MSYETKQQMLNRLNGVTGFIELEPVGAVRDMRAKLPLIHVIKALIEARDLKPGENCEIVDYSFGSQGLELEYQEGEFTRRMLVPDNVSEFFGGKVNFPEED
jgi:hypothetical protein